MADIHHIGTPAIPIEVRRNARSKRISLRISNVDGGVKLTLPKRTPLREGLAFAQTKENWIRKHITARPEVQTLDFGSQMLFRGRNFTIAQGQGRGVRVDADTLYVGGKTPLATLRGFVKEQARSDLSAASQKYGALVDRSIGKITLRDTRSRWGSCTSAGNLMYSWRLIFAPPAVLDYVAAHEVCHLLEMNHSAAYWAHVASICPDYKRHRAWLKDNGALLHSIPL